MSNKNHPVMSRRNFVQKVVGGATVAAAVAVNAALPSALQPIDKAKKSKNYGMLIDTHRCIGCHTCSVACKSEFDVPLGVTRSWVEYTEKGTYPNASRHFLPRLCNHCRHPQCVTVCPTGATYRREQDGIVVVDTGLCIGCKYCIQSCSYDVRVLNPVTRIADKCDFCIHRVSKGLVPSCVNACVGGARIFGDVSDPTSEIAQRMATNPTTVLRPGKGTEPNVYYIEADHSDEHENHRGWYDVRVITHRSAEKRR